MKILITGVAGFIGSNLARMLCKTGQQVIGIDDLSQGLEEQVPDGVDLYSDDIRAKIIYKLFTDVDVVFHLAAKNCITECEQQLSETFSVNVDGSVNVFQAAIKAGVAKVVYASSSAVYGPSTNYGESKKKMELFADAFSMCWKTTFTGLRYFNVYGRNQDRRRKVPPLMVALYDKMKNGERPIIYGTGEKRRDFIHMDEVNAFHLLCLKKTGNKIFDIGTGKNHSVMEVYTGLAKLMGGKSPIHKPDFSEEAQETLADTTAARALGWKPVVSLDEGLRTFVNSQRG
ncbi:unnamed protein product [marine sediment metagenome]|uniref:NAD-dependent epimerase/dehydratase domain-containing protein n=1 Tax=marine sediment metagenome TaxID=412755 RepID=X0T8W3_9ZZZZ